MKKVRLKSIAGPFSSEKEKRDYLSSVIFMVLEKSPDFTV